MSERALPWCTQVGRRAAFAQDFVAASRAPACEGTCEGTWVTQQLKSLFPYACYTQRYLKPKSASMPDCGVSAGGGTSTPGALPRGGAGAGTGRAARASILEVARVQVHEAAAAAHAAAAGRMCSIGSLLLIALYFMLRFP